MKKKIIVSILILSMFKSFSQEVCIEFSIEWKKNKANSWRKYKLDKTPFLNITYTNNTNESIYFIKIPKEKYFLNDWNVCSPIKSRKTLHYFKNLKTYNNEKYSVVITSSHWSSIWEVLDIDQKYNIPHESSFINGDLQDIYEFFYKKYRSYKDPPFLFNHNIIPITENDIATKLSEYFVFLKTGEKYTDSYDLTGFNILGGNYSFELIENKLKDYVETTSSWDENKKIWIYKKETLPFSVKGYKLYSGQIKKNNVNINFESIK